MAAVLQARGVGPGDHVAVLGPTSQGLVTALQATWLAGATLVPLPLPLRLGSLEAFVAQTRARLHQAGVALVVADPGLEQFLALEVADPPVVPLPQLTTGPGRPGPEGYEPPAEDPSALAIVQFTSGSTTDPKGVMLPHAQVCANLDALVAAARIDPDTDVAVSWLPLYHDMGLIGLLGLPMTTGTELVLAAPQAFLSRPGRWLEWLSGFGATFTGGPNFAYALAARALARLGNLDLSRVRFACNGAETIDPATVEAFTASAARHRLDPGTMLCGYGLAEATLAVTFPEPGTGLRTDTVERRALERERRAVPASGGAESCRRLTRLGQPLPGLELRIVDPATGVALPERTVGEIEVAGTSVSPGYYGRPDATAAAFHDGFLRTGDLGYLAEADLVVCGRVKDVIIAGGRNVFPEDVEWAVGTIEGVRGGNVVAFGVQGRHGREALVVIAETRTNDVASLRHVVAQRTRATVGLSPADVVLVPPGTLPKTTSGKLQRSLSRDRYLADQLTTAQA